MTFPSFPNLEGLAGLACREDIDIRPTLLRVLTDLYVQKTVHTADEERHYTELALRLLDAVDVSVRRIVAQRLAAHPDAPAAVLGRLARDVDEVADIVCGPGRHCGGKTDASEPAVQCGGAEPEKSEAPLQEDLSDLFFAANAIDRRLILLNIDYAPFPPARPISRALAAETTARLEAAAMTGNTGAFAEAIAHACDMPLAQSTRIAADPFGEPIVVVAKALAMQADILQRILLFLNPQIGHSVSRVYELAELFDAIAPRAARRMIAIWGGWHAAPRTSRPAPKHLPLHWNDEKTDSREMATPQPRRLDSRVAADRLRYDRRRPPGG